MMDISVSGGASGAGAASAASIGRQAGNGSDADAGGFSDVLNKASGNSAEQPAAGQHAGDGSASTTSPHARTKALIDLGGASVAAQTETKEKTTGSADKETKKAEREPKAKGKQADAARTQDLATDSRDLADKLDDEATVHSAKVSKPTIADGAEVNKGADDDDTLSDVLSLLKQAPTDGSAAAAFVAMAATSQQTDGKVSTDPKERSVASIKPKDETSADTDLAGVDSTVDAKLPGTEVAGDTDATTFRLSRADGRGQSMDMHLGIDKDAAESGGKVNLESVTVVDSRRYIGLAQNTNSAAVTATISGDPEWAQAMQPTSALSNAAEWTSTGKVVNTLKIQMNPIDLGLVTASMRLQGDALNVDLKVESGAAYRQLKEDHGKIIEALRSQGYAIDNVTISMAPVDRSDASNQASAQGQQGQTFAQQGQGGAARERQNQSGQRTGGGFNGSGESGVESTSPGAAGSGRTDDVYL